MLADLNLVSARRNIQIENKTWLETLNHQFRSNYEPYVTHITYMYQFSIIRFIEISCAYEFQSFIQRLISIACWISSGVEATTTTTSSAHGNGIPITVKRMTPRLTRDRWFSLIATFQWVLHKPLCLLLRNKFNLCFIEQQRIVNRTTNNIQYQNQPQKIVHQLECLWFVSN